MTTITTKIEEYDIFTKMTIIDGWNEFTFVFNREEFYNLFTQIKKYWENKKW